MRSATNCACRRKGECELTLAGGDSASDAALQAAEARVPKQVQPAQLGLSVRRLNDAAKPLIAVDLKAPAGAQVFVEGPTPEWALPVPKPAPGAPAGLRRFSFELDGLPPGVSPKGPFDLTFTVVGGRSGLPDHGPSRLIRSFALFCALGRTVQHERITPWPSRSATSCPMQPSA